MLESFSRDHDIREEEYFRISKYLQIFLYTREQNRSHIFYERIFLSASDFSSFSDLVARLFHAVR